MTVNFPSKLSRTDLILEKETMSQKPMVFKVSLQIADMNRHYYEDHLLTIAQHPSETNERMMVRVLAFALNAAANLTFAEGITDTHQADLWIKELDERITLWVSVGLPDEKLIRKALGRASKVIIYAYGGRVAGMWWNKLKLQNHKNLKIINLSPTDTAQLAKMAARGMKMNFTIQEDQVMIANDSDCITITPEILQ